MSQRQRRQLLLIAQVIGTTLLMIWLLGQLEWQQLTVVLRRAHWGWVGAGYAVIAVSHLINVLRWQTLLRGQRVGYLRLLSYYGAGLFANNFLPTGIGGDGLRVLLLRQEVSLSQAVVSVTLDRGVGLLGLLAVLAAGLWLGLPPGLALLGGPRIWQVGGLVLIALLSLCLIGLVVWRRWSALRRRVQPWLERFTSHLPQARGTWQSWLRTLGVSYGLSVVAHACFVCCIWAMLAALNLVVPGGAAIWIVLVSSLSLLLPVTINGLGMVESIYVLVLRSYGVAAVHGVAIALLMRALMIGFSVLGGALSLQHRQHQPTAR